MSAKGDLQDAIEQLERHYGELRAAARERLGRLFNASDYPATLRGMFDMTWDFPSVEPSDYLRRLSPTLDHRECERVQARFNEAVRLAEQAFIEELSRLVTHLTERLSGGDQCADRLDGELLRSASRRLDDVDRLES